MPDSLQRTVLDAQASGSDRCYSLHENITIVQVPAAAHLTRLPMLSATADDVSTASPSSPASEEPAGPSPASRASADGGGGGGALTPPNHCRSSRVASVPPAGTSMTVTAGGTRGGLGSGRARESVRSPVAAH